MLNHRQSSKETIKPLVPLPHALFCQVPIGAPHVWGVRVLDDTLLGFGIFPGDRLIVNRAASHLDDKLVVVDLGGEGYRVRLVQRDLFGGRWLKAADPIVPDVQLDGEEIIEVWGVVSWVVSCVAS